MHYRPVHFPTSVPFLSTERLDLAPITRDDVPDLFTLCSNTAVMKTFGLPIHTSIGQSEELVDYLGAELREQHMIRWGLREKGTSRLIGDIGFWRVVPQRNRAEIGAKLLPQFWNAGLMTEAMIAIISFGFREMRLNSIEGNADPENKSSLRMLEKLGFEREGIIRENTFCPYRQTWIDTVLISIRASQWKFETGGINL